MKLTMENLSYLLSLLEAEHPGRAGRLVVLISPKVHEELRRDYHEHMDAKGLVAAESAELVFFASALGRPVFVINSIDLTKLLGEYWWFFAEYPDKLLESRLHLNLMGVPEVITSDEDVRAWLMECEKRLKDEHCKSDFFFHRGNLQTGKAP